MERGRGKREGNGGKGEVQNVTRKGREGERIKRKEGMEDGRKGRKEERKREGRGKENKKGV